MRSPLPSRRGRALGVALALLVTGCTGEVLGIGRPSPSEAIDAFVAAWAGEDFETMHSFFDDGSADRWSPAKLARLFETVKSAGRISDFEVEAAPWDYNDTSVDPGDVDPDDEPFNITLTYHSEAARRPVYLDYGTIVPVFDAADDRWTVPWKRRLLWAGIGREAHNFAVATAFPRRAPILDRNGEKIAVGRAAERRYPFGTLAGTTIGHLEPLANRDILEGDLRAPGDIVGASGLELAYDERLAGRPATKLQVVDRKGKVLETLSRITARPGRPLRTTLDMRVQRAAQGAYATTGGAVVMDPRTGDLLAVVASSPFDPNNYVGVSGIQPFNRALSGLYPPGSALKVLTASAALDADEYKPSDQVTGPAEYKGVRNFESGVFGTLSFAEALQFSVNTAFAQIAEKLGPRKLTVYARRFGFNREHAMALDAARSSFPFPKDEGDLLWGSIGQAQVVATPLQMVTLASTIANGGKRMEPRIAKHDLMRGERVVTKETARTMVGLMENVVQSGTGVGAQIAGVRVAGKTGTAEVDIGGRRLNHAWFICFAPAGDPKVAVAVVSEYGGVGGRVAAPIARAVLAAVLPFVR